MANIIIPGKNRLGKTRSEQARNMQREGWGSAGLSGEFIDKARYLEKHQGKRFYRQTEIDNVR